MVSIPDPGEPASPQWCDNVPVTAGLIDSMGETLAAPAGLPLLIQEVLRFDADAAARAYVDSYIAGVDCERWSSDEGGVGPALVLEPRVATPDLVHGDDTRELTFSGRSDIDLEGRVAVVRSGPDVLLLMKAAADPTGLDDFDDLLGLAVERLGY